jgi:hypothetical protein
MTRSLASPQRRFARRGALGLVAGLCTAALAGAAPGCAGNLDPSLIVGGQGSAGGTGNVSGGGGAAGGTTGTVCDAPTKILKNTSACAQAACHNPNILAGGLDLTTGSLVAKLLDKPSNATANAICASNTKPYLQSNSNPAQGFLIDKLMIAPPIICGSQMPELPPPPLNATDMACVMSWATAVTTGAITQ